MVTHQAQALWELCRQGYPTCADEAESRWNAATAYCPDPEVRLSGLLRLLIDKCNCEGLVSDIRQSVN